MKGHRSLSGIVMEKLNVISPPLRSLGESTDQTISGLEDQRIRKSGFGIAEYQDYTSPQTFNNQSQIENHKSSAPHNWSYLRV